MNVFIILPLLSFFVAFFMGIFVYFKNPKNRLNKAYLFFSLLVAYWAFTEYSWRQAWNSETANLWLRIGALWPFAISALLHFALVFTEKQRLVKSKIALSIIYLPALFFAYMELTTQLISGQPFETYWGWSYKNPGNMMLRNINIAWGAVLAFAALYFCLVYYLKTAEKRKKQQALFMLLGFSATVVGGFITEGLLPVAGIRVPEMTTSSMIVTNIFIGYAIWKYELFVLSPEMAAKEIISMVTDCLVLVGPGKKIQYVNQAVMNLLGFKKDQLIGQPVETIFFEQCEGVDIIERIHENLRNTDFISGIKTNFRTIEGGSVPISLSVSFLKSKDNKPLGVIYTGRDITGRKRLEETLLLMKKAVETAPGGITLADTKGKILYTNPAEAEMHGYKLDELIGKDVGVFAPTELRNPLTINEINKLASRERLSVNLRKDGTRFPVHLNSKSVYDDDGVLIGTVTTSEDYTERGKAEESLRESELRYHTTIDALGDAIHVIDEDYKIILANRALQIWLKELDFETNVNDKSLFEVCPFLTDKTREEYRQVFHAGEILITVETTRFGNKEIVTETRKIPVYTAKKIMWVITVIRDITRRKRMEEELRVSEEKYRLLIENANEAITVINLEGVIELMNQNAAVFWGGDPADFVGKSLWEVFPKDVADLQMEEIKSIVNKEQGRTTETSVYLANGQHWLLSSMQPIKDQAGKIGSVLNLSKDITKRKRAEWELQSALEDLEAFSYAAAHDLRAPLGAIKQLADWLETELSPGLNDKTREYMDLLRVRVDRIKAFIDGMFEYSLLGRDDNLTHQAVDVGNLLVETIDMISPPESFTINIESSMPIIATVKAKLQQVFVNLLSNAIKFHHRSDGIVSVAVEDRGDIYEFTVTDNGPGIAPEYHDKVFDFFETLNPRDEIESVGIGLAIVKKIVTGQGGSVRIQSQVGNGAAFSFTWPKSKMEEQ
jgi:PAS domain S-box-containing protein